MFISPFPTPFPPRFLPKNYPLDMVGRGGGYRGMRLELKSLLQYVQNNHIFWGGWNNFTPFQHSFLHTGVKIITLPLKMLFTCLFIFKSPFPEEFVYPPPRVWWWWGGVRGGDEKSKAGKNCTRFVSWQPLVQSIYNFASICHVILSWLTLLGKFFNRCSMFSNPPFLLQLPLFTLLHSLLHVCLIPQSS